MEKIFEKRILRELKNNFFRYFALVLLIIMGMYIIISIVGSAETTIKGTKLKAEENKIENGQFNTFLPLTSEQKNEIEKSGLTLEEKFSMDIDCGDSVLRVMKNRKSINLIELDCGRLAENNNEVVLEKRYCEENDISLNDIIEISGNNLKVSGIGSVPDYDLPQKNYGDVSVESSTFGLAFVTDSGYEKIKNTSSQKAEEYCYAYRLNGKMTDDELKEMIKGFDFDFNEVNDEYFKEIIDNAMAQNKAMQKCIDELYDGIVKLNNGLIKLDDNSKNIYGGAKSIFDAFLMQANSVLLQNEITETLTEENYNIVLSKYISITNSSELKALKTTLNSFERYCSVTKEYTDGVHDAQTGTSDITDGVSKLKDETDDLLGEYFDYDIDNLTSFIKADENPRIAAAAGDSVINKEIGIAAGIIVMILFAYVISVFVVHQIQKESSVIGTLYALGIKKKSLLLHYMMLPTIIAFIGGVIGTAIGLSSFGVELQMADKYSYFSIPKLNTVFPLYLMIYGILMPPVVSAAVNFIVINKKLSQTALSLIRNEKTSSKHKNINLKKLGFIRSFQIRQMLKETRTGITVVTAMLISLLICMMAIDCYVLCKNVREKNEADTKYEYMYTLKYPPKDVPSEGEAVYSESLSKTSWGYTLDVTVMGIDSDNKYFDAKTIKGKNNIIISSAVSQKYKLNIGDMLILSDNENDMDYAFEIKGVSNYSVGLTVFMDINSMRELFGKDENYYNIILSDKALGIDEGRLYSVTTKANIESSAAIFSELMLPMVTMLIVVSIIIFFVVMYLMMKVMIDRATTGISLIKIFGYRTNEIRKLYLNGNFIIVVLGAIIGIPLSKYLIDMMYPVFIANISCGIDLSFPWYLYFLIFTSIILIYLLINALLVRKLKKISPADILKNRE